MPPLKSTATKKPTVVPDSENPSVKTVNTRSTRVQHLNASLKKENSKEIGAFYKRKAASPIKGNTLKRSALVNITNAIETQCVITSGKKASKKPVSTTITKPAAATIAKLPQSSTITKTSTVTNGSNVQPIRINNSKSMLPPLPRSRLKPVPVTVTNPKQSVGGINLRSVPATSVPIKSTVVAEKPAVAARPVAKQSPARCKKSSPSVIPANKCKVTVKPKSMVNTVPNTRRSSGRRSTLDSTDGSLYVSALSDVFDEESANPSSASSEKEIKPAINIDEEYANDPLQCATYAHEIFEYLKSREEYFKVDEYMGMQTSLNQHVRAILIDWMVEIQENFELNHETLYLGVKLVDAYLSKIKVSKTSLQLVGATAMLIAAKYDERIPPAIEDFLYICNGVYERRDVIKMEVNILKVVRFELSFPLSYRFLRRYARCAKVPMPLLTLARYILEFTLMDYSTIFLSDSKMAAAALYLAFKMKKEQEWDNTLIYFSGYKVKDFIQVAHVLNNSIHQKPKDTLATVRNKYSHKIFYEVAKTSLISNDEL